MIILISGTPAAGKSSVSKALAQKLPRAAYISVDTLRDFIISGYVEPWNDTEEEGQTTLASTIAKDMAQRYVAKGFTVIVDDVITDEYAAKWKREFENVTAILLTSTLEELHRRDMLRSPENQLHERIDELHHELIKDSYTALVPIDTTHQTIEETVEEIFAKLSRS